MERSSLVAVCALALLVGCRRAEPEPANTVARVDGEPVALSEARKMPDAPGGMRGRIDAAVLRHLAAVEAERRGLAESTRSGARSVEDEERLRDALFASMRDSLVLSEDDLRAHYEKNKLRFMTRQMVLRRKAFPSEAEARAEDRRLGQTGRIEPAESETIGPAPVDRLPPSILPEAVTLTGLGQRAAVMRGGRWSLVELEEIRVVELPFETVRPQVEQGLRLLRAQSEFHAEIDQLRQRAKIEVSAERASER